MEKGVDEMFAFFIHPRDTSPEMNYHDLERIKRMYGVLPFHLWIPIGWFTNLLSLMPRMIISRILPLLPPIVSGRIYSGRRTVGWIVTVPMTARQILDRANGSAKQKKSLEDKFVQAVRIGKRMGAKIVGLGAMTSPATVGGRTLVGKVRGMSVTNGSAFTAVITVRGAKDMAEKVGIDLHNVKIAVVGATGTVGKATTILLSESLGKCQLLLISRSKGKLNQLKNAVESENKEAKVSFSEEMNALRDCGVVIVTTSDPNTIIHKDHLKKGTVIYDDTQPRNVSKAIARDSNFLVVDGGIVRIPSIRNTMDIGLPTPMDMYACEAEACFLSEEGKFENFSIGRDIIEQSRQIMSMTKDWRISLAPFKSFEEPLTDDDFRKFKEMRANQKANA